jgi:hypothetical protein
MRGPVATGSTAKGRPRRQILSQKHVAQLDYHIFVNGTRMSFPAYSQLFQFVENSAGLDLQVSRELIDPTGLIHKLQNVRLPCRLPLPTWNHLIWPRLKGKWFRLAPLPRRLLQE